MSVQATFSATLVDEWIALGVTDAVICPGSRSTPLAIALSERLHIHVRLDERSAGFYALGLALASGKPTVICVTSGTAAAELHPAVIEAHHGRVPLIVCTADRPPELQDVGAFQTIDQIGLFTTATRWAFAPGVPDNSQSATWRPLAARAVAEATAGPYGPGPVHLNLAFREPLTGIADALPQRPGPRLISAPSSYPKFESFEPLSGRGIVITGAGATRTPSRVLELGQALHWPVLADPRSGCRFNGTIAAADAIVRTDLPLPDHILLLGDQWLSKPLSAYISRAAEAGSRVIAVDPWWRWTDPSHAVSEFHDVDPDEFLERAIEFSSAQDESWLSLWQSYEQRAQAAIDATLGAALSEPQVARQVFQAAADLDATLFAAASMAMRDLEWFAPTVSTPPRVLSNRGTNGIDGLASTALGVAASGQRTIALLGDLAFLHDVSGLVNLDPKLPCTFVVLDNGGGGIFSFLPQAGDLAPDTFERLFATPPTSHLSAVAQGFGLPVREVTALTDLEPALRHPGCSLVRVQVPDRTQNAALHEAVNRAVGSALT